MIEKVEKILNSEPVRMYPTMEDAKKAIRKRNAKLAQQICQLFEPKPDEGRLLTDEELKSYGLSDQEILAVASQIIRGKQDAKTASIKDAEWGHHVDHIVENERILGRAKWQALKEGVK